MAFTRTNNQEGQTYFDTSTRFTLWDPWCTQSINPYFELYSISRGRYRGKRHCGSSSNPMGQVIPYRICKTTWVKSTISTSKMSTVGRYTGWPKTLAGFRGTFITSLQALSDPQEGNIRGPWVWIVIKLYTGNRCPSKYCGCAASTRMYSNARQGGNGKAHTIHGL